MTTDLILTLAMFEHFAWCVDDDLYAFSFDDTKVEDTNGWGCNVKFRYQLELSARILRSSRTYGNVNIPVSVKFNQPFGSRESMTINSCYELSVDAIAVMSPREFIQRLQQLSLTRDFWQNRRSECENYLKLHSPDINE